MKAAAHLSLRRLLLTGLISLATCTAQAQTQAQAPPRTAQAPARPDAQVVRAATVPGTVVAVVDINYLFENHAGFKNAMEQMGQEAQQYQEEVRTRHQALNKERDQMMQYAPGSPEYERMERALADKAAKLQVDTQLKKKDFVQRESRVYYQVYQEVSNAVQEFAEMKGIDLVLQHSSKDMKAEDRASVLQGVNRPIVFQRNLDITREIHDRLNRASRVSNRPRPPAGAPQETQPRR